MENLQSTSIAEDFNAPVLVIDRTSIHKISKNIEDKQHYNQFGQIDIYRTLQTKTTKRKFFSSAYGTFTKIDLTVDHKTINVKGLKSYGACFLTIMK